MEYLNKIMTAVDVKSNPSLFLVEQMYHNGTERTEHIHIVLKSAQEAYNVIPDQLWLLIKR